MAVASIALLSGLTRADAWLANAAALRRRGGARATARRAFAAPAAAPRALRVDDGGEDAAPVAWPVPRMHTEWTAEEDAELWSLRLDDAFDEASDT